MSDNLNISALSKKQTATKYIRQAADKTGVDFNYLLQTAKRESALNTNAKAPTSSATGLFQFIKQTWYETLKNNGDKYGYGDLSQNIKRDSNGRYFVPNQQAKTAILELRKDPKAASLMAAEFSKENIAFLKGKIGREPLASELYIAHFMGRSAAAKLIDLKQRAPEVKAAEVFPKHAASNKTIFYKKGHAKSIAEVYANLAKQHVQIATEKGLDPEKIEDIAKLVPFLPSNSGFFSNLFGQQNEQQNAIKPLAYTNMGNGSAQNGMSNSLLFTQMAGQQNVNNAPPIIPNTLYDSASIAKGANFFSLTAQ